MQDQSFAECNRLSREYAYPRLTAEELLQRLRAGKIRTTEISRYAWRLEPEDLTKFMDLLLPWMNERKYASNP